MIVVRLGSRVARCGVSILKAGAHISPIAFHLIAQRTRECVWRCVSGKRICLSGACLLGAPAPRVLSSQPVDAWPLSVEYKAEMWCVWSVPMAPRWASMCVKRFLQCRNENRHVCYPAQSTALSPPSPTGPPAVAPAGRPSSSAPDTCWQHPCMEEQTVPASPRHVPVTMRKPTLPFVPPTNRNIVTVCGWGPGALADLKGHRLLERRQWTLVLGLMGKKQSKLRTPSNATLRLFSIKIIMMKEATKYPGKSPLAIRLGNCAVRGVMGKTPC